MQNETDKAVSTDIVDRYNDVRRKLENRPVLKPILDQLDKAMNTFRSAVQATEDALSRAESAVI